MGQQIEACALFALMPKHDIHQAKYQIAVLEEKHCAKWQCSFEFISLEVVLAHTTQTGSLVATNVLDTRKYEVKNSESNLGLLLAREEQVDGKDYDRGENKNQRSTIKHPVHKGVPSARVKHDIRVVCDRSRE